MQQHAPARGRRQRTRSSRCSSRSYLCLAHHERQEGLEVPVAHVGDVEADEPEHHQGIRSRVQCVRTRCRDDRGHRGRLEPEQPERPRHQVEQRTRRASSSGSRSHDGPEEALGVDELLVEDDRRDDGQGAHDDGDADEQGVGTAIHGGQSRRGARGASTRISRAAPGSTDEPHPLPDGRVRVRAERPRRPPRRPSTSTTSRTCSGVARADDARAAPAPPSGSTARAERRTATAGRGGRPAAARTGRGGLVAEHPRVAEEERRLGVGRRAPDLVDRRPPGPPGRRASRPSGRRPRTPPRGRG